VNDNCVQNRLFNEVASSVVPEVYPREIAVSVTFSNVLWKFPSLRSAQIWLLTWNHFQMSHFSFKIFDYDTNEVLDRGAF
jgi:hypothetical protein